MALVLKNNLYGNIKIDSNKIIGVMGNYYKFIKSINNKNISLIPVINDFYTNNVYYEMSLYTTDTNSIDKLLKDFDLNSDFLNKNICFLSDSLKHLLKYMLALLQNKKIIIIDEPFIDMDYSLKKKIKSILKRIIYETDKTIIICSNNSNIIYELCDSVLLLDKDFKYGKTIDIMKDNILLEKYNIDIPDIIDFINLIKSKGIIIDYSVDIRDLIKDVYKCVS